MILGFSTRFPAGTGKLSLQKTFFVDKITRGLVIQKKMNWNLYHDFFTAHSDKFDKYWDTDPNEKPKLHTIRRDSKNRWKAGNDIHFYINVRKKNQFQFAPVVKCVSVQKIEINWKDGDGFLMKVPTIWIDGRWIVGDEEEQLAINDGFNSIEDFYKYFNTDFEGKIIHWTNLKY